jgi:hypothetical protein
MLFLLMSLAGRSGRCTSPNVTEIVSSISASRMFQHALGTRFDAA